MDTLKPETKPDMPNKYPTRHNERRADLATIHMAATQLGMDTADKNESSAYRAMLWAVAREHSSAALDFAGRRKVIDHLKACGFKPSGNNFGKPINVKPELAPMMGKIGALLADMKLPWSYASAIAKRMTSAQGKGIDRLEWLDAAQLHCVVTALVNKQSKGTTHPSPPLSRREQSSSSLDKGRLGGVEGEGEKK
jgi:phage gp16-like protein